MNHVIETVGSWGVRSTPAERRWNQPRPGDLVRFDETVRRYPVSCHMCRISSIDRETKRASIVDGMGSAFLLESGDVSISGGPFFGLPLSMLEATHEYGDSLFWNWGDNSPGAGQGVEYRLQRPIFRALCHPDAIQLRYGRTEADARSGGVYRHEPIPAQWSLFAQSPPDSEGCITWSFWLNPAS